MPTPIYHITHIDNLPSILNSGGLVANSRLKKTDYIDIAHQHIQDRRGITRVPRSVGSDLAPLNINTELTPQKYRRLNYKTFVSIPLIEEFSF